MSIKKITDALLIAMILSGSSCSSSEREHADMTGNHIQYFKDPRTLQCFAAIGQMGGGYDNRTMTWVPCEPVKKFLDNP